MQNVKLGKSKFYILHFAFLIKITHTTASQSS